MNKAECFIKKIEGSLDRLQEVHWYIHQMADYYHDPDPFRFSFNGFLRSIREIPQSLSHDLQNEPNYKSEYKLIRQKLDKEKLFCFLKEKRNFIVHQAGILTLKSTGYIGATEGRIVKIQSPYSIDVSESSYDAYEKFKNLCKKDEFVRKAFGPDCDSWPFLKREWKIPDFNTELLSLATESWSLAARAIKECIEKLGGNDFALSGDDFVLCCMKNLEKIKTIEFDQREFFKYVDNIDINNE